MFFTQSFSSKLFIVIILSALSTSLVSAQNYYNEKEEKPKEKKTTRNQDYEPQPYYVDGVEYRPYAIKKNNDQAQQTPQRNKQTSSNQVANTVDQRPSVLKPANSLAQKQAAATTKPTVSPSVVDNPQNQPAPNTEGVNETIKDDSASSSQSLHSSAAHPNSSKPKIELKRKRYNRVVLQALDKITALSVRFEVPVGQSRRYKGLVYTAKACEVTTSDERQTDAIAYIHIRTTTSPGQNKAENLKPRDIFSGWSFASSPALNPVEHPIYDVWVIGCRNPQT